MQPTDTQLLDSFWFRLASSERAALLLDYDGTLAPFVLDRNEAVPYAGVHEALQLIVASDTRCVIVSGRQVTELQRLMPLASRLELWGSHGLQRGIGGYIETLNLDQTDSDALMAAEAAAKLISDPEYVELKPGCVAVHTRALIPDEAADRKMRLDSCWQELIGAAKLDIHRFDGGIELRSTYATKRRAVSQIIEEEGRDSLLAFLGDDLTDEDAFEALRPHDLAVLVRPEWRQSRARIWIRPPQELLGFLSQWAQVRTGQLEARPIGGGGGNG